MRFQLTQRAFINGHLREKGAIVDLPEGSKGEHLIPLDDKPKAPTKVDADAKLKTAEK